MSKPTLRRLIASTILGLVPISAFAVPDITPRPLELRMTAGKFLVPRQTTVAIPAGVDASVILSTLNRCDVVRFSGSNGANAPVTFRLRTDGAPEAYDLTVTPAGIVAEGSAAGLRHAAQTLSLMMEQAAPVDTGVQLDALVIHDAPRFPWRGYMLDESRHFSGMEAVKQLLDGMARYKLNRFHWHLTDSPGWRIEIKKYPKLTEIGSRGHETRIGPTVPARFYTQDQIREIVAYAKARGITVIPEIDMPGHADAAVRSYPEHDGGGYATRNSDFKWRHFTYNPGRAETRAFLDDILTEVAALFPDAGVIHFGGDEVHFGWKKWPELPEVRELMKNEKLADNAAVEAWFNRRMGGVINKLGFKAGGWDEIVAAGLPADKSVVFWWRHDKPDVLHRAIDSGYPVVLCPRLPLYFDFIQSPTHRQGRVWGKFNPVNDVYAFPESLKLSPEREAKVLGIQACLWTESARMQNRRDFLTWPRLVAMAEAAWTPPARKDYADFGRRLRAELPVLRSFGFTVYNPFENSSEITDPKVPEVEYLDNAN